MNEQNERLSALLDEWHGDDEERAALDRVLADVNERARWQRYQLIGEALRHELPQRLKVDFSAEVMAQIEQQGLQPEGMPERADKPNHNQSSAGGWWSSLLRPVAGLSVAVAVAFVAVTSLTQRPDTDPASSSVVASVSAPSAGSSDPRIEQLTNLPVLAPARRVVAAPSASSTQASGQSMDKLKVRRDLGAVKRKLNGYLVDHNQYASSLQGLIPQVRVVATGDRN